MSTESNPDPGELDYFCAMWVYARLDSTKAVDGSFMVYTIGPGMIVSRLDKTDKFCLCYIVAPQTCGWKICMHPNQGTEAVTQ
jgi:hypothetical protein